MENKQWCYFMFLLWLAYLMISSAIMFTRGFLLTRVVQEEFSTCHPYDQFKCKSGTHNNSKIDVNCPDQMKMPYSLILEKSRICIPAKSRLLLIVVDALRYEFINYDPSISNPLPYQNKLPVFNELLEKHPRQTRLYKFIADAPTTTLQRLKALTTGSLPTFIDAGSNFASHNITEDNIIDQMLRHDKKLVFLGDDVWNSIYPERFHRSYTYPGLNTWDLDTVDYGVYDHLVTNIQSADWDLMIVHISGVDHVGHRYGPYHPEMIRKLKEVNNAIRSVVNVLQDDTLLYVVSDHGTTKTGDHGGESDSEVEAAMFVYSPLVPLIDSNFVSASNTIKQIDLVPTLATVLGVPIPFSSLGTIIFDAIPLNGNHKLEWREILISLWTNIEQITDYIRQYSKSSDQFNAEKLETIDLSYVDLNQKIKLIHRQADLEKFIPEAKKYMKMVREMCEEVWIQFDSFSMSRGLLLMFLTIFFTYMIIDGIPNNRLPEIFMSSFLVCSYAVMGSAVFLSIFLYYLNVVETLELTIFFSTGMVSIFMLAMLVIQNWELIALHWFNSYQSRNWLSLLCRLIIILSVSGLFSNSYIVHEDSVLMYLVLTLVWILIYNVGHVSSGSGLKGRGNIALNWLKIQMSWTKIKLIVLGFVISGLIRASQSYWKCRSEQKTCNEQMIIEENLNNSSLKSATRIETFCTLAVLVVFVSTTRIWLRRCGNLVGFSLTVSLTRYLPSVIIVCTGGFWIFNELPKEIKNKMIVSWKIDTFAWFVYFFVFVGIFALFIRPLCVYIIPKKKETISVYGRDDVIPQLFQQVKGLYQEKSQNNSNDNTPIVYGLGTVYSASFVVLNIFVLLLFALLLGDKAAVSSVIMFLSAISLLFVISISHFERVTNVSQLFDVPGISIVTWAILCQYFFYGTGHQPTFPNINWSAAFVGTGGYFWHNAIPATLIGINTFGPHLLFGLSVPLLLIAPFTLYVMFPNLATTAVKVHDENKEMKRGELMLYERDNLLLSGVFAIGAKYMIFFGIRMFICMLTATIHCRHLMVWTIFAPKLIFEGLGLFVTLPAVLVGYLLLLRTNHCVESLIMGLDKSR